MGLAWCKNAPKTVGLASLTARILCREHNSALSDTDKAAAAAFHALQRAAALDIKRGKQRARKWKVSRYEIDGRRLERWFLKTLINIVVSRDAPGTWALSRSPLNEPPDLLVRAAFGRDPLPKPLGLYAAAAVGESVVYRDSVELATLLRQEDGALVGALFTFMGLRFLLYLEQVLLPQSLPLPIGHDWMTSDTLYHLARMNARRAGKLSHYVHFLWSLR